MKRATGQVMASSDEGRDALFHFFQDAYHLKDWIKNDPAIQTGSVDAFMKGSCAGPGTAMARAWVADAGRDAVSERSAEESASAPRPALHYWRVESGGQQYDALALAHDVVEAWDLWLRRQCLLP